MKIFEIHSQGEKTWVAAETNIGALICLSKLDDSNLWDYSTGDEIVELPDAEWDAHTLLDEDGNVTQTFRQWMDGQAWPEVITSTTWN
jgi:hypothetical protein